MSTQLSLTFVHNEVGLTKASRIVIQSAKMKRKEKCISYSAIQLSRKNW